MSPQQNRTSRVIRSCGLRRGRTIPCFVPGMHGLDGIFIHIFIFIFILSFLTLPLSSLWTSRGHRCRPFFPPVLCLQFLSRIGVHSAIQLLVDFSWSVVTFYRPPCVNMKSFDDAVIWMQESAHKVPKSASQAVSLVGSSSPFMHPTRPTLRGASRLGRAMSAWSVKSRRALVSVLLEMRGSMVINFV